MNVLPLAGAMGRRFLGVLAFALAGVAIVGSAASRSAGAPASAAEGGCGCHGTATAAVSLELTSPANYTPGMTYDLRLKINGAAAPLPAAAQNQGGFSIKASEGELVATDSAKTQPTDNTLTHTAGGNDQREWAFQWKAPAAGVAKVTFSFAGNGVNGDGTAYGDQWNRAKKEVPLGVAANNTTLPPPSTSGGDSPGPAAVVGLVLVAAVAVSRSFVARARGRQGRR